MGVADMASVETSILKLGQHSNGMLLTPWEFDSADFEEGWRYELVNGVLVVNAAPLRNERDANGEFPAPQWLQSDSEQVAKALGVTFGQLLD